MNKIQRATRKFIHSLVNYEKDSSSKLYHACYFTRAFNPLLPHGYDTIDTCPLCDDGNNIIGIVVLGSYYEEVEGETHYYSRVLHQVYFTRKQLNYIRAHGYDKVA